MSWDSANKIAIVEAFYQKLFAAHPGYQDKFSFKGVAVGSLSSDPHFQTQRGKTIGYIDQAVAGTADPKGLASRHVGRHVGPAEFKAAKAILVAVCKENGCTTDMGPAVDAIIGSF